MYFYPKTLSVLFAAIVTVVFVSLSAITSSDSGSSCYAQEKSGLVQSAEAPAWPPVFTPQEKQQAKSLANAYKKEKDSEKQEQLIRSCTNLAALSLIQKQIQTRFSTPIQEYQKSFARTAQAKVNAKIKKANTLLLQQGWLQAAAARKLDYVSSDPNKPLLTKQTIQNQVKPAFDKAYDAFWVEPVDIVDSQTDLAQKRKKLLDEAPTWDALSDVWNQLVSAYPTAPTLPRLSEMLDQLEFDLILAALPVTDQGRKTLNANRNLTFSLDLEEARCISLTNRYRILLGLAPQAIDLKLCAVARDHSCDMKTLNFFDHNSPVAGKTSFSDRAKRMGVSGAGSENIYMGATSGASAAEAWFYSPGHHKNMFNENARIAVGRYQEYFTQMTGWAN